MIEFARYCHQSWTSVVYILLIISKSDYYAMNPLITFFNFWSNNQYCYSALECNIIFSGDTTKTEPCGIYVCLFPRLTCCPGFTRALDRVNKVYYCGPLPNNSVPIQQTTCCDPGQQFLSIFKSFRKRPLTTWMISRL